MFDQRNDLAAVPKEILHPGSRQFFRYWEGLRGERAAPDRADLDLMKIKALVPSLFILERNAARQTYRWRLAGTAICRLWRQELTGSDVFRIWRNLERDLFARFLDGVVGSLQPCVVRLRLVTSLGQSIPVELLCLPLRSYDGQSIHVLGTALSFADVHQFPDETVSHIELSSARAIWTEPLPNDPLSAVTTSPVSRPFANFRVIEGGRSGEPRLN
jgi:hypothetical protein